MRSMGSTGHRGSEGWREMTHEQGLDGSTGDHQEDKAGRELQTESMKLLYWGLRHTASTAYSETKLKKKETK